MNLKDYMDYLGWGNRDLARNASINARTASKAIHGDVIRPWVAQKIAAALSTALKTDILPGDIDGLNIERK
jgi:hypothetical protein